MSKIILQESIGKSTIAQMVVEEQSSHLITGLKKEYQSEILVALSGKCNSNVFVVTKSQINRGLIFRCNELSYPSSMWKDFYFHCARVLFKQDYRLVKSSIVTTRHADVLEMKYFIYLKPSLRLRSEKPMNQLFGNSILELVFHNDRPYQFKLLTNVYRGRGYGEALDFEDLLVQIFAPF